MGFEGGGALSWCAIAYAIVVIVFSANYQAQYELDELASIPGNLSLLRNQFYPTQEEKVDAPVAMDLDGDGFDELVFLTQHPSLRVLSLYRYYRPLNLTIPLDFHPMKFRIFVDPFDSVIEKNRIYIAFLDSEHMLHAFRLSLDPEVKLARLWTKNLNLETPLLEKVVQHARKKSLSKEVQRQVLDVQLGVVEGVSESRLFISYAFSPSLPSATNLTGFVFKDSSIYNEQIQVFHAMVDWSRGALIWARTHLLADLVTRSAPLHDPTSNQSAFVQGYVMNEFLVPDARALLRSYFDLENKRGGERLSFIVAANTKLILRGTAQSLEVFDEEGEYACLFLFARRQDTWMMARVPWGGDVLAHASMGASMAMLRAEMAPTKANGKIRICQLKATVSDMDHVFKNSSTRYIRLCDNQESEQHTMMHEVAPPVLVPIQNRVVVGVLDSEGVVTFVDPLLSSPSQPSRSYDHSSDPRPKSVGLVAHVDAGWSAALDLKHHENDWVLEDGALSAYSILHFAFAPSLIVLQGWSDQGETILLASGWKSTALISSKGTVLQNFKLPSFPLEPPLLFDVDHDGSTDVILCLQDRIIVLSFDCIQSSSMATPLLYAALLVLILSRLVLGKP